MTKVTPSADREERSAEGSAATIDGPGDPCADLRKSTCPECGREHYIGHTKGKAIATRAALDRSRYTVTPYCQK